LPKSSPPTPRSSSAKGGWTGSPRTAPRADVEALWEAVLERKIDWIVSDHACCSAEQKWSKDDPDNIWLAKSGFGGTEYLLSGVVSEGGKRGLSYNRMAQLLSWNPAQRFGLLNKGDIAPGFDADIVLLDPNETFTVRAGESESEQGYSLVYHDGNVVGPARGQYLRRPIG
jgi:allantoinase